MMGIFMVKLVGLLIVRADWIQIVVVNTSGVSNSNFATMAEGPVASSFRMGSIMMGRTYVFSHMIRLSVGNRDHWQMTMGTGTANGNYRVWTRSTMRVILLLVKKNHHLSGDATEKLRSHTSQGWKFMGAAVYTLPSST
jgi:hypothetical protein